MPDDTRALSLDCEVVQTRDGTPAVRDRTTGELMHRTGPLEESRRLYVDAARLADRLRAREPEPRSESLPRPAAAPLVLLDVGLGAGSNALAAWQCSEARTGSGRPLHIVSLDRSAAALELVLRPEHASDFGWVASGARQAGADLLADGQHHTPHTRWTFHPGDIRRVLPSMGSAFADVVFWDPFSPRVNPELWTLDAFAMARGACRDGATLHTYSGATAVRAALLLAGFAVGTGEPVSAGKTATCAATSPDLLESPLGHRWLERLRRSAAPFPPDAPRDALDRIAALPQFC